MPGAKRYVVRCSDFRGRRSASIFRVHVCLGRPGGLASSTRVVGLVLQHGRTCRHKCTFEQCARVSEVAMYVSHCLPVITDREISHTGPKSYHDTEFDLTPYTSVVLQVTTYFALFSYYVDSDNLAAVLSPVLRIGNCGRSVVFYPTFLLCLTTSAAAKSHPPCLPPFLILPDLSLPVSLNEHFRHGHWTPMKPD